MFEDTFLIIKWDYLSKRKEIFKYLIRHGFIIKAQRKCQFTPELAAEFYKDFSEEPDFMFRVILLSKGICEAVILAKEKAVVNLLHAMVCYFQTSTIMEKNVHVTHCCARVRQEIQFVFPNYIYEPIFAVDQLQFCTNNPIIQPVINELYEINKQIINSENKKCPPISWKDKLASFLINSNNKIPSISNCCAPCYTRNLQERGQQTMETFVCSDHFGKKIEKIASKQSSRYVSSSISNSLIVTTSSCITCSGFHTGDDCLQQHYKQPTVTMEDIVTARTARLDIKEPSSIQGEGEEEEKLKLEEAQEEESVVSERDLALNEFESPVKISESYKQCENDKPSPITKSLESMSKIMESFVEREINMEKEPKDIHLEQDMEKLSEDIPNEIDDDKIKEDIEIDADAQIIAEEQIMEDDQIKQDDKVREDDLIKEDDPLKEDDQIKEVDKPKEDDQIKEDDQVQADDIAEDLPEAEQAV